MGKESTIAILGAGFGGVRCALTLERLLRKAGFSHRIVLIDKNRYHTFIPAIYEVASAAPGVSEDALYSRVNILIKNLIAGRRIEFVKAEVSSIKLRSRYLALADGNGIDFDYLVIALGSQANFYHIKGLDEHSINLKNFVSAINIRRAVKLADEMPSSIIIGGGGTTGVELGAELSTCFKDVCPEITIVHGQDRILPSFPENISELATKRLLALGVKLKLGHRVKEVHASSVTLDNGEKLPFDVLFWTGGIAPHRLIEKLPAQKEEGFLKVSTCLEILSKKGQPYEYVFALGDATIVYDDKGKLVPWTAQKAIDEGEQVAQNIVRILSGSKANVCIPQTVRFIIPIGGKWAIVKLNGVVYAGFFGWVLKNLVELRYLASILPWHKAFFKWIRAVITFSRND